MSNITPKEELQKQMDKLEEAKLEEVTIYTIEVGSYNHLSTTDKEAAFKVWQLFTDNFFSLEQLGSRYEPPHFHYRKPIATKLQGEKKKVWVDQESAQRAFNAWEALSNKAKE